MASKTYRKILNDVHQLDSEDQHRLLDELADMLGSQARKNAPRSVIELRGLGEKVWSELNIEEYLNGERASWNGEKLKDQTVA